MTLTFEPLISPALWVTLAALAAALLIWYGVHRPASVPGRRWVWIVALMAAGTAAVLLVLLNPTWLEPIPPPAGKPLLTVLVDRSASMATADVEEAGQSRYAAAANAAMAVARDLDAQFDVRLRTFAETVAPDEPDRLTARPANGELTDLARAVAESLEADRPQGQALLVLSDGIHNAPPGVDAVLHAVQTARAMDAPIYTTTLGGETVRRDLEISVARPQELSFVGQRVPITVLVRQRGVVADRVEVVVTQDGNEVAREPVRLAPDAIARVQVPVASDTSGLVRYEVRVDASPLEATAANNSATVLLRAVDEPLRVLLLEGKPYWDAKFLVRTLSSDSSLELDSIVRLTASRFLMRRLRLMNESATDPSAANGSSPVAQTESTEMLADPAAVLNEPDALAAYQVIVLGRNAEIFLGDVLLERLRTWIARDGGSLVCYRGSPVAQVDQQLARLMPVRWSPGREARYRMSVTERGQDLSWLGAPVSGGGEALSRLPSLATVTRSEKPRPLAVVLATTEAEQGPPVVTYQPYGTGRVVTIEGAGMWRWAFLAPQYQELDATYAFLWQSLIRWLVSSAGLAPGQDMALRTDKVSWTVGEPVSAVLLVREELRRDALPSVELVDGDGQTRTVAPVPLGDEPGVYRVPLGRLPEGRYEVRIAGRDDAGSAAAFDVRRYYGEQLDVAARPDLMARIARDSGGEVIDAGRPGEIAASFQEHLARSRPERVRRYTAWDKWWVLAGVLGLWACAWGLRRQAGLV